MLCKMPKNGAFLAHLESEILLIELLTFRRRLHILLAPTVHGYRNSDHIWYKPWVTLWADTEVKLRRLRANPSNRFFISFCAIPFVSHISHFFIFCSPSLYIYWSSSHLVHYSTVLTQIHVEVLLAWGPDGGLSQDWPGAGRPGGNPRGGRTQGEAGPARLCHSGHTAGHHLSGSYIGSGQGSDIFSENQIPVSTYDVQIFTSRLPFFYLCF
jgi:hypothetical protein